MQLHDAPRYAQPDPDPQSLVVKNGVKILSETSAGIAPPLLLTSIRTVSSDAIHAETPTQPSLRPSTASRAFFSRFTTTCSINLSPA